MRKVEIRISKNILVQIDLHDHYDETFDDYNSLSLRNIYYIESNIIQQAM